MLKNPILKSLFCNIKVALMLLAIYVIACGVATFVESAYSTNIAKSLVYSSWWFEVLHLWLALALIGCFLTSKSWQNKKYATLLLHFSFIIIVLGAGITRYFGFEASMPIKNEETTNVMYSIDPYIIIHGVNKASKQTQGVEILTQNPKGKHYKIKMFDESVKLTFGNEIKNLNEENLIEASILVNGESKNVNVYQSGLGTTPSASRIDMGDMVFFIAWGSKVLELPFKLKLEKFVLDRYAGSNMPSSYSSFVQVVDGEKVENAHIFMNNVLDYGGYRFFQSSYFQDESGTILSVNNDPGKIPTYIGYVLLFISFIWLIFTRSGRFYKLANYLRTNAIYALILVAFILGQNSMFALDQGSNTQIKVQQDSLQPQEDEQALKELLENLISNTKNFAKEFDSVLIQDFNGRVKPFNTLADEYMHKITGKDNFLNLSNTQLMLAISMYPQIFNRVKMIKVNTPRLRELLGNEANKPYVAMLDAYTKDGEFLLANLLEKANVKPLKERDAFDKDIITFTEKLYLFGMIYTGKALRLIPNFYEKNGAWFDFDGALNETIMMRDKSKFYEVLQIITKLGEGFKAGVKTNDWGSANEGVAYIKTLQKNYGGEALFSSSRVKAEILLNKLKIFDRLMLPYILFGLGLFITSLVFLLSQKAFSKPLKIGSFVILLVFFALHTFGLGLRWYAGDHAPWSNAYESMLYIAWASALSGLVMSKFSTLSTSTTLFLAGICLFVAHLAQMDPQIGNLVPVLKSYWLNIHVSIITASYGFLGLCFMLSLITFILFAFRSNKFAHIDKNITTLNALNEMSMIIGLAMLTIGNFLGGVWANESWGRYWGWDPKETWSLITIIVYALILHLRLLGLKNMSLVFPIAAAIGFFSVLMTYFGVNFFLVGMHSYASANATSLPWYIYVFSIFLLVLIVLAVRKRATPPKFI